MMKAPLLATLALLGACTGTHVTMKSSGQVAPQPAGTTIAPSIAGDWITQDNTIPPGRG
jgi:hypothetical protein